MAKKLESNFINMVVVLFSISLIASAGVGYVYTLTKEPIAKAAQQKQQEAIRSVMPGQFDNDPAAEKWKKDIGSGIL
ncbi:MAG: electron transporter RnfG, partial [Odoribacter sp.]|nr:electron transporter RnfG [Odoribacter sp.]